ncbi:MAG: C40 family peptidase [Bacteroidetes bacterium]|nr:C40 family peptidase [Bacteroidota bacterium]
MRYAICPLSVVPVRSGAQEKSEQITQILFGECVEVIDRRGKSWSKVHCLWDDTIGWVDSRQLMPISENTFAEVKNDFSYSLDLIHPVASGDNFIPVPLGARLPQFDGIQFELGTHNYTFSGQAVEPVALSHRPEMLLRIARKYLGAPQMKGGRSPLGIDAAGLIQNVFGMMGISLPRSADEQVFAGDSVDFAEQATAGDLAFFENRKGQVDHVGLILPEGEVLHVSGHTKIDQLDHYGAYERGKKSYIHKLRVIRRLPLETSSISDIPSNGNMPEESIQGHPELFGAKA